MDSATTRVRSVRRHNISAHPELREAQGEARKAAMQTQREEETNAAAEGREPRQLCVERAQRKTIAKRKAKLREGPHLSANLQGRLRREAALRAGLPWPTPEEVERRKEKARASAERCRRRKADGLPPNMKMVRRRPAATSSS